MRPLLALGLGDILGPIVRAIRAIASYVLWALVSFLNLLVAAIGAFINFLVGLLPTMPAAPSLPSGSWIGWLSYYVPVGGLVSIFLVMAGLLLAFLAIRVALKWMRVV